MAVITGFPCPSLAQGFVDGFAVQYDNLPPLDILRRPTRVDQIEYRVKQMACVTEDFLTRYRDTDLTAIVQKSIDADETLVPMRERDPSVVDQLRLPLQLTVYWDKMETADIVGKATEQSPAFTFPFDVTSEVGIDISFIDSLSVDAYDRDDDRNYRKFKQLAEQAKRSKYLHSLASELNIPHEQISQTLNQSRLSVSEDLVKRGGKQGKKARTRNPNAPHGKHTNFDEYRIPQ